MRAGIFDTFREILHHLAWVLELNPMLYMVAGISKASQPSFVDFRSRQPQHCRCLFCGVMQSIPAAHPPNYWLASLVTLHVVASNTHYLDMVFSLP
jgi:hypothetical protein